MLLVKSGIAQIHERSFGAGAAPGVLAVAGLRDGDIERIFRVRAGKHLFHLDFHPHLRLDHLRVRQSVHPGSVYRGRAPIPITRMGREKPIERIARPRDRMCFDKSWNRRRMVECPAVVRSETFYGRVLAKADTPRLGENFYFKKVHRRNVDSATLWPQRACAPVSGFQPE